MNNALWLRPQVGQMFAEMHENVVDLNYCLTYIDLYHTV